MCRNSHLHPTPDCEQHAQTQPTPMTEASATNSTTEQHPRRTWRQWSKLARVRIGFVLMLIVAISAFAAWLPRRNMLAVMMALMW